MRPPAIGFRNLKDEVQGNNAVSHQEFVAKYLANLTLTWESIEDVRRQWDGPLYIKGILTDRKSTRLNSSHVAISYAVFCLKKKKSQDRERCATDLLDT